MNVSTILASWVWIILRYAAGDAKKVFIPEHTGAAGECDIFHYFMG